MQEQLLYVLDLCPTCSDSGRVFFVRDAFLGNVFFFCPGCGVAWPEPPSPGELTAVAAPERFAPTGLALPTEAEIAAAGYAQLIRDVVPYASWGDRFGLYLSE